MKIVDLFCGCGGMSLGFAKAGFDIVAGFENWDAAYTCYNANFNNRCIKMDLSNVDSVVEELKKLSPQIIIGGPPCQDFSLAGDQVEGARANLTYSFAEIISKYKPSYFVMENVQQVVESQAYMRAKQLLIESGYGITERVLDASFCGVPQKRKRFFCIGGLGKENDFLSIALSAEQSIFPLTIREYLNTSNKTFGINYYYRHPRTYGRRAIFSIDEPSPTIRGVNRPKPSNYKKHDGDPVPPTNIRALTYLERACIQTFPDNYIWDSSVSVSEQMIGNAVPVNLALHVATALKNYISNKVDINSVSFVDWLMNTKHLCSRAASDVLSRANRARRIKKFSNFKCENYLTELSDDPIFQKLNRSTQSELRRAVILYFHYKEIRRERNV